VQSENAAEPKGDQSLGEGTGTSKTVPTTPEPVATTLAPSITLAVKLVPAGPSQGRQLSFYNVIGCHWLPFLRDLRSVIAAIAVTCCQNDSVAPG
jgi:hypothetical protein